MPGQKLIGKHCQQQQTATKTGLARPLQQTITTTPTATAATIKWPRTAGTTAAAFCEPLYLSDTGGGVLWMGGNGGRGHERRLSRRRAELVPGQQPTSWLNCYGQCTYY